MPWNIGRRTKPWSNAGTGRRVVPSPLQQLKRYAAATKLGAQGTPPERVTPCCSPVQVAFNAGRGAGAPVHHRSRDEEATGASKGHVVGPGGGGRRPLAKIGDQVRGRAGVPRGLGARGGRGLCSALRRRRPLAHMRGAQRPQLLGAQAALGLRAAAVAEGAGRVANVGM